jgi:hypothetical protein
MEDRAMLNRIVENHASNFICMLPSRIAQRRIFRPHPKALGLDPRVAVVKAAYIVGPLAMSDNCAALHRFRGETFPLPLSSGSGSLLEE